MTRAAVIARHRQQRTNDPQRMADEWFPEQRKFYDSKARLLAALCGRRAGKTRGLAAHFVREAATKRGARLLYINHTLDECRRLFWIGNAQDGVYSLVKRNNVNAVPDRTRLTLTFPETDSTIELRGAKDETELSKALGSAYTEIAWDEAQKIRPSMAPTIREVLMPTLLDHAGRLRYTGTANRQQSGLFWELSQPQLAERTPGFELHEWNMLANPHFGRAVTRADGTHWVYALKKEEPVGGPFPASQIEAEVVAARMKYGIEQLATDLGVPIDSPIVQREGFGRWCAEDDAYVYAIRKARDPFYAEARVRDDGFPDIPACLADLPRPWTEYTFSLGGDLGFRDAFALHCWAWHPYDPALYELFSWKRTELDSDQQFNAIKEVRAVLPLGQVVVDAGGVGLSVSTAWSKVFVERYNLPIVPAEKHEKHSFQAVYNTDIASSRVKFRDGSETVDEMMKLCWSKLVTGSGKQIEDPTQDNHCCLVAGTMVETEHGPRTIETITAGDKVWTRSGLRPVLDSWCSGIRETWRLITDAGREIIGSGNHPIYTSEGWIRLDGLIPGSTLCAWESTDLPRLSSTMDIIIDGTRRVPTSPMPGTFNAPSTVDQCSSIEPYGAMRTDPFRPDVTSIISMRTPLTTHSTTSSVSTARSTYASTCRSQSGLPSLRGTSLSSQCQPPEPGIDHQRGAHGMSLMGSKSWPIEPSLIANASSAVRTSEAKSPTPRFAACDVTRSVAATVESTTSIASVLSAASHSASTGTATSKHAHDRVQRVERTGSEASVFNLSVEGEPEYFANGILVHNCDASLYSHRASYQYRARPENQPPEPGTRAAYERQAAELEEDLDEEFDQPWRRRGIA